MILYFGLELDDLVYPRGAEVQGGIQYLGPKRFLLFLESHLGLLGPATDNEHLRIEQFRQAIRLHLDIQENPFYQASFTADQLATSARLLQMRDELVLSAWDFQPQSATPQRLATLAEIEQLLQEAEKPLVPGFADRFAAAQTALDQGKIPLEKIYLNEPLDLLPPHFQALFQQLQRQGCLLENIPAAAPSMAHDLQQFQAFLNRTNPPGQKTLRGDGSLLVLRAKRETDAAVFLAKMLADHPDFQPLCLIPEKNRALDNALIQEGLPSLGILSASLARPSLQILKLITAFLWQPVDPFKIMEFVSLSIKPLHDDLAEVIANLMAQTPGLNSDNWRFTIARFFEQLEEKAQTDRSIDVVGIRKQFDFWFNRKRYDSHRKVPRKEVIEVFEYLQNWAFEIFDEGGGKNSSLNVLSQQARRIVELLEALPETEQELSHLELERIVRTIYEPSPVVFSESEVGHLPYVHHSSSVIGPVEQLIWWNFTRNEQEHFFSRWYQQEIQYLQSRGIRLQSPKDENALLLWHRPRAILQTQKRLLLVLPEKIDGSPVFTHPLFDELEAAFSNLELITFQLGEADQQPVFQQFFQIPKLVELDLQRLGHPKPFLHIPRPENFAQREHESFTSLETLFYYPYQWVFRHKIRLRKSSILSIVKDVTLMGNLAHRFFELLFKEDIQGWDKAAVEKWIDERAYRLLSREGAVLLLYGREPERIAFINKIKYAAWSLVAAIQQNGWQVMATEKDLQGKFLQVPIKGKADLVLQREQETVVIDLKWRGAGRRINRIRNEEDIQLVTYSRLLTEEDNWAHTCFFILEKGQLIARNNLAFQEIIAVAPESDDLEVKKRIWEKMERTYRWRRQQLAKGQIEIRTQQTLLDLEDTYGEQLLDLLEMKDQDAPFDDYRTLINLIE